MDESMERPCPELPVDVLALIFARVFYPADRTRFQAVSRSWRLAARPPPRQLPWIMHPAGGFLNPSDRILRHLVSFPETASCSTDDSALIHRCFSSFPENMRCIGSTDGWIAVDCQDVKNKHKRTYLLHNEFSGTTLSLPELDAAIGHVSELFEIRKVLMRSTPDDIIALMTNHYSCHIILTRRGKGVWFPKQHADPLINIIDVSFLGDRLYGITLDEDLVYLDIASDDNDVPIVTGGKCVIGDFGVWSDEEDYDDDIVDDDEEEEEDDDNNDDNDDDDDDDVLAVPNDDNDHDEDDDTSDCEGEYKNHDDNDDDDDDDKSEDDQYKYDLTKMTKDDSTHGAVRSMDDDINIMWYLIESRGKLLMVRRQVIELADPDEELEFTHKVEIFEANMNSAKWEPVKGGLGGQALFISRPFCKSVSAACSKEIQEDAVYFIDTDDVFDMRSKTISPPREIQDYWWTLRNCHTKELTWVFPPELVA